LVTGMIFTFVKIAVRSASSRVRSRMDCSCPIMPDYPLWRNRPVVRPPAPNPLYPLVQELQPGHRA
jgi:hypothetical protein